MENNETVAALREAIKASPDNVPLREHLGGVLNGLGRFEEAQSEFSVALAVAPDNIKLKLGLATSFYHLGKFSQSLVLVEDTLRAKDAPAKAHLLYARLLLNDGKPTQATAEYQKALQKDASVADAALADQLGFSGARMANAPMGSQPELDDCSQDLDVDELNDKVRAERPKINFADVGGMEAVKEQVRMKIIHPLNNPSMFAAYGKKVGGGILLYGPPGCGKTHLARATAGEIKAAFISIGISDVLDMWIGSSERNLHELFQQARRLKPCVMFFDEVDALAASRSETHGHARQIINQFLLELDGIDSSNDGVLVLAATNAPWHLDSAFRRPGRFDRIIFVPPPDPIARAEVFRLLLKGKPLDSKIDFPTLGKKTEKYSGADICNVIDVAVEKKLEQAMKTGNPQPITMKDLEDALKFVKPSTLEWLSTAKNYAMYANQSGVYDDVLQYIKTS